MAPSAPQPVTRCCHHLLSYPSPSPLIFPIAQGFVLGKPFWGVPRVRRHAEGEAAGVGSPAPTALEEALSAANLTGAVLSMPGMDGFFMYEYAWKRVRQEAGVVCGRDGGGGGRGRRECEASGSEGVVNGKGAHRRTS